MLQQEIFFFPWCYTLSLFLRQLTFLPSLTSFHYFFHLSKITSNICLSPSFYRYILCSYLYNCLIANRNFRDIFLYPISFLPSLILEFWLLGVFVLFRLSHMHSIRQRLGENPLINMEVKIFSLLACSRSFPWLQASSGNYTWIIRAPHYE